MHMIKFASWFHALSLSFFLSVLMLGGSHLDVCILAGGLPHLVLAALLQAPGGVVHHKATKAAWKDCSMPIDVCLLLPFCPFLPSLSVLHAFFLLKFQNLLLVPLSFCHCLILNFCLSVFLSMLLPFFPSLSFLLLSFSFLSLSVSLPFKCGVCVSRPLLILEPLLVGAFLQSVHFSLCSSGGAFSLANSGYLTQPFPSCLPYLCPFSNCYFICPHPSFHPPCLHHLITSLSCISTCLVSLSIYTHT